MAKHNILKAGQKLEGTSRKLSRRQLIQRTGSVVTAVAAGPAIGFPTIVPSTVFGENAPTNRVTVGFIGVGTHGLGYNLNHFLKHKDAQVLAVCDVFKSRRDKAQRYVNLKAKSKTCDVYSDFRDVLARKDIDAIAISTPDHWHVPLSLLGLAAGKDVFCEKPTLTIAQGRQLVNTVKKHNAVFQAGIEDRSVLEYHRMAQIVRIGGIGKLQSIEVVLPEGERFEN
jgi:myo-inositol 2-dehydrogenase / D-chiro-inositol 1-dehydrogenase